MLVSEKGYNKNDPPVPFDQPQSMENVSVSIDILKLIDINEEDYSIKIQFSIFLKWVKNRAT